MNDAELRPIKENLNEKEGKRDGGGEDWNWEKSPFICNPPPPKKKL